MFVLHIVQVKSVFRRLGLVRGRGILGHFIRLVLSWRRVSELVITCGERERERERERQKRDDVEYNYHTKVPIHSAIGWCVWYQNIQLQHSILHT